MSYPQSFAEEFKQELASKGIALSRASECDSINEAYSIKDYFLDSDGNVVWAMLISQLIALGLMDYECSRCGCNILGAIPEADRDGYVYCDKCADEYLAYCEECDERYPKHSMLKTEDGYYCQHCYEHNCAGVQAHGMKHTDE